MKKMFVAGLFVALFIQGCAFGLRYTSYDQGDDYLVLRVFPDRYYFYRDDYLVAEWIFLPGGICIRRGMVINGPVRMFYSSGRIAAEITYRNNRRHGDYRAFDHDGDEIEKGSYNNGDRNSDWVYMISRDKHDNRKSKADKYESSGWDWKFINKEDNYRKFKQDDSAPGEGKDGKKGRYYGEMPNDKKKGKGRGWKNQ